MESRRDPYFWLLNANLNINLYGVNIPLSATLTQQNRSFTQPFNQFGISPKYKGVTVHLGYRSMVFSNYSSGGNIFLGGGVDLAPANSWVKLSSFYGRFTKAVAAAGTDGLVTGTPAFERWGGGLKLTMGKQNNYVDLIAFKAKDRINSIPITTDANDPLKPAENFVASINTAQKIGKKLSFNGELAFSAYTVDQRAPDVVLQNYTYINNLGALYKTNASSQFNKAIMANIVYSEKYYQLKFMYRRIDPEYKSLGCVFLNNDLEDITATVSWRMLKNKINMSTSGGLQRNNVNKQLATQMTRLIGSANITWAATPRLNFTANVANFNSSTSLQRVNGIDSLSYSQVTTSGGGSINYSLGNNAKRHNLFLMGNAQQANDNSGKSTTFYNSNLGYQLSFSQQALSITGAATASRNASGFAQGISAGFSLGLTKQLLAKKLRLTVNSTYLQTYLNNLVTGSNRIYRVNTMYTINKHHALSADINALIKISTLTTVKSFQEYRGTLVYTFTF
ncbi:MAG: hypothetical protein ACJ76F_14390 [Bacteroidia bacterium]